MYKSSGRPTLSDIATQAGVSVSTASLVLSDKAKQRRLSDDVVARVRKVAADLDYSPNLLVQSLQQGRTHTLSFFNGFRTRSHNDLYMDRLTTAIEQAGGRLGYDILIYCVFERSVEETYRHLNGGRCDGVLMFAAEPDDPLLPYLRTSRLPTVLVNSVDTSGALSCVKEDHVGGLTQLADQLVALGHKRIAALGNVPGGNRDADLRIGLLRQLLADRGVPISDRWIIHTDDNQYDDAAKALRFLMAEPTPPTALFCWHDRLGYQVLEHCERMGIVVPDQLSLIGYDGLRWPAQARHVLSSVEVNIAGLADAAVTLLHRQINGLTEAPICQELPVIITPAGTTLARIS
ncbi:LacI family transcriptional regulator [Capsulimonas corticalis]|uniref:LacI family transcriptional regulator n=1 Tax=Capsulimonas corticalis TaxID=2219043 RepID=A0A402CXE5_9BACT|nr:LacI family DNA-binding transcriptional regulator [Capsulimonas corticalis]BDI32351.1 LacI family transcriptional regulator [Capsulimonas corticalis]